MSELNKACEMIPIQGHGIAENWNVSEISDSQINKSDNGGLWNWLFGDRQNGGATKLPMEHGIALNDAIGPDNYVNEHFGKLNLVTADNSEIESMPVKYMYNRSIRS